MRQIVQQNKVSPTNVTLAARDKIKSLKISNKYSLSPPEQVWINKENHLFESPFPIT